MYNSVDRFYTYKVRYESGPDSADLNLASIGKYEIDRLQQKFRAYSSIYPGWAIRMQKARGVKIGKNCHINPYVLIDLMYPQLITIENNVSLGSYSMIFAHSNPTANLFLKQNGYPRVVKPVLIKEGAVINPGTIITAGVTIGKNSMISVGSVVSRDVPDFSVVAGNPARVIKKIDH